MVVHLRQLPNFFVLGSRRSGTGSLTHYLEQHPAIRFSEPRDPGFFQKDELYHLGIDYYARTFCPNDPGDRAGRWLGEATSSYFAYPHMIGPRLRSQFGDTPLKFIVLLREPVSRAWSHYLSNVHHGCEKRDFATALAEESLEPADSEARYFAEGCYARLLSEWQTYYPLENFLLLLTEDLAANPLAQAQRVFTWLGVDAAIPVNVNERLNSARYSFSPRMVDFLNHPPAWLKEISKRIWPQSWRRRRIRHYLREQFQATYNALPTLDTVIAGQLRQHYQSDVLALSKILGRYLSHWLAEEGPTGVSAAQKRLDHTQISLLPLGEKIIPGDSRDSVIANDLDHGAQKRQ